MRRGLIIGNFAPYHNGHHQVILKAIDELKLQRFTIVLRGYGDVLGPNHPFTFNERAEMIKRSLPIDMDIAELQYLMSGEEMVRGIHDSLGMYSKPEDRDLWYVISRDIKGVIVPFSEFAQDVSIFIPSRDVNISGSSVRLSLIQDDHLWRTLVPTGVMYYLDEIKATLRIQQLISDEKTRA